MNKSQSRPRSLAARFFGNKLLLPAWLVLVAIVFNSVGVPLGNALLVCWVRGAHAYLHEGVRVVKDGELKFSDGVTVPGFPAAVIGILVFSVFAWGLTFLLLLALRAYEKHTKRRNSNEKPGQKDSVGR